MRLGKNAAITMLTLFWTVWLGAAQDASPVTNADELA